MSPSAVETTGRAGSMQYRPCGGTYLEKPACERMHARVSHVRDACACACVCYIMCTCVRVLYISNLLVCVCVCMRGEQHNITFVDEGGGAAVVVGACMRVCARAAAARSLRRHCPL